MARYRGSFATTRTSFKGSTQAQTKEEEKPEMQDPVVVPFQIEEPKAGEQIPPGDSVAL